LVRPKCGVDKVKVLLRRRIYCHHRHFIGISAATDQAGIMLANQGQV
jgi:hypothetical protein